MKRKVDYLKTLELALCIGFVLTLLWGTISLQRQEQLADKVVRLHVLANSDSEADQALKLQVRDSVIGYAEEILRSSANRDDAEKKLRTVLPQLEQLAAQTVAEKGYAYPVTVQLQDTWFSTREYDGFTLPAGEYLALRLVIGEGAGRNWW